MIGAMSPTGTPRHLRVLVLSADVGEGHAAAARALAEGLHGHDGAEVVVRDGLAVFGPLVAGLIRDGYRTQLRRAPWTYDGLYRLAHRVTPVRALAARMLARAARRRLLSLIAAVEPGVVVSTHPALTAALGRLRLRGALGTPVSAAVTDLGGEALWAHRGVDLHLVMHESAIAAVERVAGTGSTALVRPLVGSAFLQATDRPAARARAGLTGPDPVVVVSGGGWGVGDLVGAVEAALTLRGVRVVALAGRSPLAREALRARFGAEPRVRVLGFTDRMADLLAAADAVVHSTGGMTSLEALSRGCPQIAYGSHIGHIRVHNDALAALGLVTVAADRAALSAALRATVARGGARAAAVADRADAAAVVLVARARVVPVTAWRIATGRLATGLACLALVLTALSTDDAYSLAARPLELRPLTHVVAPRPEAALVVRGAEPGTIAVARAIAGAGGHASFAVERPPDARTAATLRALGDDWLPELPPAGRVRWFETRDALRAATRIGRDRRYLAPASGLELGQYLLGRTLDASPVAAAVRLDASSTRRPAAGDVVAIDAGGPPARATDAVDALRTQGLSAVALSALLSDATADRTPRAVVSTIPPAMTAASAARIPAGPSGA
jgi:processive 1,2-diacylglycerol beta-glucosyltransferase